MKIAIITEGTGEFKALPRLYPQLQEAMPGTRFMRPLKVNVPPDAPQATVATACLPQVRIACRLGAGVIVVLLDRERQTDCCGLIAEAIARNICLRAELGRAVVHVALKDRQFENWLVADPDALRMQPARFQVTAGFARKVGNGSADRCDAYPLLKSAVVRGGYDKIDDADRICSRQDVRKVAATSRSFRHFLHVVGYPDYRDGCRTG